MSDDVLFEERDDLVWIHAKVSEHQYARCGEIDRSGCVDIHTAFAQNYYLSAEQIAYIAIKALEYKNENSTD